MTRCLLLLAVILTPACAQERPVSMVVNGGFERSGGWSRSPRATTVESGRTGRCLHIVDEATVTQGVPPRKGVATYSCSVEIKTEDVVAGPNGGFAFAAVYQRDGRNELVAFKDFAQVRGTTDWQRADFTFELAPRVEIISLHCGIFNASGKAWFDNWTLVEGDKAMGYDEVTSPGPAHGPGTPTAGVFRHQGFPVKGAGSSPDRLGGLLRDAGFDVRYLTADDLADPARVNSGLLSLVVLPYGQSFPAEARRNFTAYLHGGGSFISTGGYTFEHLVRLGEGQWLDEATVVKQKLAAALERSVLPDGSFEAAQEAPIGGQELDGKWRRDGDICTLDPTGARDGDVCARVTVDAEEPREDRWYLDIAPQRGASYCVSGWMKSENVRAHGQGYAYMALYEYDGEGKLGEWEDFAHTTGTQDWTRYEYTFTPSEKTTRVHIKMGLFQATGTAWFDDIRLSDVADVEMQPMNTSTGGPADGLKISPSQIGVFDADYPLRRVASLRPAEDQLVVAPGEPLVGDFSGWAASGVQGYDNARWIELVSGLDRFGRHRGSAASLMLNYGGYFSGSAWAYFGVENEDIFDGSAPWLDRAFVDIARFICRGGFLRNLTTDLAAYKPGETVRRSVVVENLGGTPLNCTVGFSAYPDGDRSRPTGQEQVDLTVEPGFWQTAESPWEPGQFESDVYELVAELRLEGRPVDRMSTGFVVQDEEVVKSGRELRFEDNYFTLDGRPTFLFGSDTYSNVYNSATENPWTWNLDHIAARDYGFNVYENLQYSNADYRFTDKDWRKFEGMAQLCQRNGLVFMPCQLVGHNVAIGPEQLEREAAQCRDYAEHLNRYPGLLYYLNGDFRWEVEDKAALTALWNRWLAERYPDEAAWRQSWGEEVYGNWGELQFPPPAESSWDSVRQCDRARFGIWVTLRWVNRHVAAVREADEEHAITSEYYRQPYGALDLILTIGEQDASNIGYFDEPYRDVDNLPLALRLIDLRMRGKSLGLGEYGVKTHPAWTVENGARGYHIVRTEEEARRLFMAVAHYGMGMGACKVQNWCLRDASETVFPWGVFYPNGRVPKDIAYWHRNLSLIWRHFTPEYQAPKLAVLLPDGMRLGANSQKGLDIAANCFRALFAKHAEFSVINERHVEALQSDTVGLIWPSAFCPDDAAYAKVLQWVTDGGRLLVTGDISFDENRRRTRTQRLEELCGVQFVEEIYRPPVRPEDNPQIVDVRGTKMALQPCIEVQAGDAEVVARTENGMPVLVRKGIGKGTVLYCTDPLEMGKADEVLPLLKLLYPGGPAEEYQGGPDVHLCRQPLRGAGEFVTAFNTNMPPGAKEVPLPNGKGLDVKARAAARYPAMLATNERANLVSLGASGEAQVEGSSVFSGDTQVIGLALDSEDLWQSQAVLLCPFSTGQFAFHSRRQWTDPVTIVGDIIDSTFRVFEVREGVADLTVDEDLQTCLLVVCERGQQERWTKAIEDILRTP